MRVCERLRDAFKMSSFSFQAHVSVSPTAVASRVYMRTTYSCTGVLGRKQNHMTQRFANDNPMGLDIAKLEPRREIKCWWRVRSA